MTEQPGVDIEVKAAEIASKVRTDALNMKTAVDRAVAAGAPEEAVIEAIRDAFLRSLTELAREEPDAFALVVVNLIMVRGLGSTEPTSQG